MDGFTSVIISNIATFVNGGKNHRKQAHDLRIAILLAIMLALSYGCATRGVDSAKISLRAPLQAGACKLTNRTDSGDTQRGIAFTYSCPQTGEYSAFFYESKLPASNGTVAVLNYERDLFVQALAYQKQRGFYSDYTILKQEYVKPEITGGELVGLQLVYLATRGGTEFFSGMNLFVTTSGMIKLRWTVPREVMRQRAAPSFVPPFMEALAAENALRPLEQ